MRILLSPIEAMLKTIEEVFPEKKDNIVLVYDDQMDDLRYIFVEDTLVIRFGLKEVTSLQELVTGILDIILNELPTLYGVENMTGFDERVSESFTKYARQSIEMDLAKLVDKKIVVIEPEQIIES